MLAEEDVALAATLVALGFPGDHTRYSDARVPALDRWRADPPFRQLAQAVARGLGVELLEVTPAGQVVVVAHDGTPFTPVVETLLPGNVSNDERRRQVAVLALLAAIAEVFPTADSLAEVDASRAVSPAEVVALLLARAESVSREPEPAGEEAALRRAFQVARELQPSAPTKRGQREGAHGLEGIVTSVLRDLAEKGLFREERAGERPVFRPTAALAPHVRHLLDHQTLDAALDGLRAARGARVEA
jgi:hypothetical protein